MTEPLHQRHHAPATLRNREPILAVLRRLLPETGLLLEIASGTGEHAAFMAPRLSPGLEWQPSDVRADALADIDGYGRDSGCSRIRPAIQLDVCAADWPIRRADAVFCANMIHIARWAAAEGLFAGLSGERHGGLRCERHGAQRREQHGIREERTTVPAACARVSVHPVHPHCNAALTAAVRP